MKEVTAAIITIGDELLIGQTIDTNSAFIGQQLNSIGIWLRRRMAVGDVREEILSALAEQSRGNQLVIITGGLGPTADDITKPVLCEYFGSRMIVDESVKQHVTGIFERAGKPLLERNIKQAEVPHNCTVLHNSRGTAPGMWFEKDGVFYVALPGVPHEMKGLMVDEVLPKLLATFSLPTIVHRTLLLAGKGESEIAESIATFENSLPQHIKLAYLPAYGMVRLRLTGRSADRDVVEQEVNALFEKLKTLVQDVLVADKDIPLQQALGDLLLEKGKTVSTAESCTGGYIAQLITARAGASRIFKGGIVAYDNEVKKDVLQVQPQTLEAHGAVSRETVMEMASGLLEVTGADYAIATSGIMGPGGGTPGKPVGTVWVAVGDKSKIDATCYSLRFDRARNIELTAHYALNKLRLFLVNKND